MSHITLSGLISTQTIAQFREQNQSYSRVTSVEEELYTSAQTSVYNAYEGATVPRVNSQSVSQEGGDLAGELSYTSTLSGRTQGKTATRRSGGTGEYNATRTLQTTSSGGYGTSITRGFSYSFTRTFESAHDVFQSSSSSESIITRSASTQGRGRNGTNGGYDQNQTMNGGTTNFASREMNDTGYTQTTSVTFESFMAGGITRTGTRRSNGETVQTTTSSPADNTHTGSNSGTFSATMSPSSPIESTQRSTTFGLDTYSRMTRYTDTMTSSQFVFSNSDTTITVKKTTLSTGEFTFGDGDNSFTQTGFSSSTKHITRDTIASATIEAENTATDATIETFPVNIASTFTVYGNAGFVTASRTGTFDMKMTEMPQFVTSPGVLKPGNIDIETSIDGDVDVTHTFSTVRTTRDETIVNESTVVTFESRSAEYSRQTFESFTVTGDESIDYSSALVSATTESFFQTSSEISESDGTSFYTTSFTARGFTEPVDSFIVSTTKLTLPIVFFDGTSFSTTQNEEDVYVTTTGQSHKLYNASIFGGSNASLFQTTAVTFNTPIDSQAKALVTNCRPRIHSAIETVFGGEKAFVQATNNSSDRFFAKQFPPILEFTQTTTTEGETSTTTTDGTFITGLGSIRPFISLMFTDTSFTISNFKQNEDSGVANNRAFTIQETGADTDINYIEDERLMFNTGVGGIEFVGGKNNIASRGFLTAFDIGSFKIGTDTFSLSSNETFLTQLTSGSPMQKIENKDIPFASHADRRTDNVFANRIPISHLNRGTRDITRSFI